MKRILDIRKRLVLTEDKIPSVRTTINPWIILAITTGVQASVAFVTLGVGPLIPFLESGLGLNKSQVGLIGGAVNVGMTLTAVVAGRLVDSRGEKQVFVIGALLTGVATIIASFSNSFLALFVLLLLAGASGASGTPAGSKAIMTWFPRSKLGLALSVRQTGVPIGGLLAALTMPPLATVFGWHAAMASMGLVPVCGAILCQMLYKTGAETESGGDLDNLQMGKNETSFWNRDILLVSLTAMTYLAAQSIVLTFLVLYFHDHVGLATIMASKFLVLANFGGIVGRVFWGSFSDVFFARRRRPAMASVGIFAMSMAVAMLFLSSRWPIWLLGLLSWLLGFSSMGWNGVYVALISELAGIKASGTAVGLSLSIHFLGALIFPPIFGKTVDFTHSYVASWLLLAVLLGIGVMLLGIVKEEHSPKHQF